MSDALTILQDHKPASSMRSNSSKPCAIRGRGLCGAIHNGEPVPASGKLQKGCGIYPVEVAPSPHRETVQENCMQNILGIFSSRAAAEEAVQGLLATRIPPQSIIFLSGEAGKAQLDCLPTDDAEHDGMGEAVGAVVGGAMGTGAGLSIGSAVASLLVPGVGTIFAIGLGAAAILGIGGAAAGASAGKASEGAADIGVPKDDTLFYRELLKRGRSLVIANVETRDEVSAAKIVFDQQRGEDIEVARKEVQNAA